MSDIAVDPRGFLYLSHTLPPEVRVFDPGGGWVSTFGREGKGPGELQAPGSLDWGPEGRLWVADSGSDRFEVFDTSGARVASHRYEQGMYQWGDRWGTEGLLYTNVALRGFPFRLVVVRRRLEEGRLVPVDTVPAFGFDPGEAIAATFEGDDRRHTAMVPVPFQRRSVAVLDADRGWWVSDPGADYRLLRTSAEDTLLVIDQPYERVAVDDEDVNRALARLGSGVTIPWESVGEVHPPLERGGG